MQLENQIALIAGGSSGIGEAIARKFADEGATCAVVASTDIAKANAIADDIGRQSQGYACNVTQSAEVAALVERVLDNHGQIDVLVNSAGIFVPTPAGDTKLEDLDTMIDVNLKGTMYLINAVTPHMKERQRGNIINVASAASVCALPLYGVYCATKAGVVMLTRVLATELSRDGIHVNAISPGNTETPMNEYVRNDPEYKPILDFMENVTPSGRTYSTAEEMADMALFLASPKTGRSIYGANFVLDEGLAAGMFVPG
ncbi:MAG: 3-oxoacyl-[acyl-carrier protein] reductase [Alphaproteobacteria bacterium]|jgi:3-oxoacyl-[acyl-carrier protein] reductase